MLYQNLLATARDITVTFSVVGANGQFGQSLLSNMRRVGSLRPQVLCDVNTADMRAYLLEVGYDEHEIELVETEDELAVALAAGKVAVTASADLAVAARSQVLIEATGVPEFGIDVVSRAIDNGSNIVMINKEADSVGGIALARRARSKGLNYVLAHGDQPRNLIELLAWSEIVGLEVIAAGKSSEYDYVYDPATRFVHYLDRVVPVTGLDDSWLLGDDVEATLARRAEILSELPLSTAPDYGEMSLVANATGLLPSRPEFHYPLARIDELADIYIPKQDGGILESSGVVDVFNLLRRPDEPSFGGGVFIVVRANQRRVWEVLRSKGHVVSRNGDYGCVYLPYHFMGLETPISILAAALEPVAKHPLSAPERRTVVGAETLRDFAAGEYLELQGAHHTIEGTRALILEHSDETASVLPYYLAGNRTLAMDVPRGTLLTEGMVEIGNDRLVDLWKERV